MTDRAKLVSISGVLALMAALVIGFLVLAPEASAAKPQAVVEWSNGFPSGPHFNLNIHGKKSDPLNKFQCPGGNLQDHPETGYGGSVFVPEYESDLAASDPSTVIRYFQNKRSSVTELLVHDACAGYFDNDPMSGIDEFGEPMDFPGNDDPINVQLPKGEYQVYARILGKPKKVDEERSVLFYPRLIEQCDFIVDEPEGGDEIDCSNEDVLGLGLVTDKQAYVFDQTSQSLERIAPVGKGKNKATDISSMFQWTGYVCDIALDISGPDGIPDGRIDGWDVPAIDVAAYDTVDVNGFVDDGIELENWLDDQVIAGTCELFTDDEGLWVFDIAGLVVYGWDYVNNGSKLVQIRFYPTGNIKQSPDVATEIHDNGDDSVIPNVSGIPAVALGKTVHDQVTVTGPTSGKVSFVWYENGDCSGTPADTTGPINIGGGMVDATSFAKTPGAAGHYAFRARYNGNSSYDAKWSPCEPLRVVEMASLLPATDTNPLLSTHTVTAKITDGTSEVLGVDVLFTVTVINSVSGNDLTGDDLDDDGDVVAESDGEATFDYTDSAANDGNTDTITACVNIDADASTCDTADTTSSVFKTWEAA